MSFPPDGPSALISVSWSEAGTRRRTHLSGTWIDVAGEVLVRSRARLVRTGLAPAVVNDGGPQAVVAMLDRANIAPPSSVAAVFLEALREHMSDYAFVPSGSGDILAVSSVVVPPPLGSDNGGAEFRDLFSSDFHVGGRQFPARDFCTASATRVLADLGADQLASSDAVAALARSDPGRTRLRPHPTGRVRVDPVLSVLEARWRAADATTRGSVELAARSQAVFPISLREDGTVDRTATDDVTCFYPPRSFTGAVPLERLSFLLREVARGDLSPRERNDVLSGEMIGWQALFGLREFKFADVMRAAVPPHLEQRCDGVARGPSRSHARRPGCDQRCVIHEAHEMPRQASRDRYTSHEQSELHVLGQRRTREVGAGRPSRRPTRRAWCPLRRPPYEQQHPTPASFSVPRCTPWSHTGSGSSGSRCPTVALYYALTTARGKPEPDFPCRLALHD